MLLTFHLKPLATVNVNSFFDSPLPGVLGLLVETLSFELAALRNSLYLFFNSRSFLVTIKTIIRCTSWCGSLQKGVIEGVEGPNKNCARNAGA